MKPKYVESANGEKFGLGPRRSKYTAILEKLNDDLARVKSKLLEQIQENQQLRQELQCEQQQNYYQHLQYLLNQLSQAKSTLMYEHASATINDFLKISSPIMLVFMDFNHRIIDANTSYLREHGWTRDEVIGRRLPVVHMMMFFLPGYDTKKIPIDENDIPPFHGGLPRGIDLNKLYLDPMTILAIFDVYAGRVESVQYRDIVLDGKGRLFKTNLTHWLAM